MISPPPTEGRRDREKVGDQIARMLTVAWRENPPVSHLARADLERIAPLALRSGAGPITWVRVSRTGLAETSWGTQLQQAYRLSKLNKIRREREAVRVVA